MNFSNIKNLMIPEGSITALSVGGVELWSDKPSEVILNITGSGDYNTQYTDCACVTIDNQTYTSAATLVVPYSTQVSCSVKTMQQTLGSRQGYIRHNGETVSIPYSFAATKDSNIALSTDFIQGNYVQASGAYGMITITDD